MANNDGYRGRGGNDDNHGRHKRHQPPDGASARGRGRAPRAPGRLALPDWNCPTGEAIVKTTDTAPSTAGPPNEVTPAMKAAIVSAVVDALKSAMEIHLSPINSRLKGMQSDISSNHGHVTKCLFPDLEAKLTTLDGVPDSKTRELDAKGESLLAKITSLDSRIATNVGKRIANLETKVEVATNTSTPGLPLSSHNVSIYIEIR